MAYSDDDDFAQDSDYDNWAAYMATGKFPKQTTLARHRNFANTTINKWIGCYNSDITDPRFTEYLKNLEIELIKRREDKEKDRKTREGGGIYTPHDYMYQAERDYCMNIGVILGFRKVGGVG